MVAGWAQAFTALLDQGTITGFALITASGACQPVTGPFVEECAHGSVSLQLQLLAEALAAPEVPTSFVFQGTKLITLHRGPGCYLAVSTHNTDGIVAVKAAGGVLLASFNRPTLPTIALTAVQEACEVAFKRKRGPDEEPRR